MRHTLLGPIASLVLWSGMAHAGPAEDRKECLVSADRAQRLRKAGKLRESRDKLVICARAQCPSVVRKDCEDWLGEVEALLPSVVVTAKDAAGKDIVDVKVSIDDKPMTERLDGKAIEVDPGVHTFRYEAAGAAPVVSQVVVREGDRARPLEVTFEGLGKAALSPKPEDGGTTTPAGSRGAPVGAIVFGALGAVGIGTFGFFFLSAKSDRDDLRTGCAPNCSESQVDDVNRKVVIADVALGAGIISLGVAAYLLLTRPNAQPARSAITPGPGGLRIRF